VTAHRTNPPITQQQNTEPFLRLLAAQRRLYADVKASHNRRLVALAVIAFVAIITGAVAPGARNYVGPIAAIGMGIWAVIAELAEKKKNGIAASIQEEFDTGLYRIERHPVLTERPREWDITEAAARDSGDGLPDWYQPRSLSDLARPLDVIICQRANLDYGVSLHRAYARLLVIALASALIVAIAVGAALQYSLLDWLLALLAPSVATVTAVVKEAATHLQSAAKKTSLQATIAGTWRRALNDPTAVTGTDCRAAQDGILKLRQENARVPDWFYDRQRDKNEATMLATSSSLVEEARAHGHALPGASEDDV